MQEALDMLVGLDWNAKQQQGQLIKAVLNTAELEQQEQEQQEQERPEQ